MVEIEYTIEAYAKSGGTSPTEEALLEMERVSPSLRDAMRGALILIRYRSNHGGNLTHHLERGLWSVTVQCKKKVGCLFFTFRKGRRILLLNGTTYSRANRPAVSDLDKARKLVKEVRKNDW